MARGKFYHVFMRLRPGVTLEQAEVRMNLSVDWFRYDVHNWLVYSTSDADTLWSRFKPLIEPEGLLLVCEINVQNKNGWMSKSVWDWLNKKR
jgi:hypothetical protein